MIVELNGRLYTLVSENYQTHRCGKISCTLTLRCVDGHTEIDMTTTKDWKELLNAKEVLK